MQCISTWSTAPSPSEESGSVPKSETRFSRPPSSLGVGNYSLARSRLAASLLHTPRYMEIVVSSDPKNDMMLRALCGIEFTKAVQYDQFVYYKSRVTRRNNTLHFDGWLSAGYTPLGFFCVCCQHSVSCFRPSLSSASCLALLTRLRSKPGRVID